MGSLQKGVYIGRYVDIRIFDLFPNIGNGPKNGRALVV